MKRWSLLLAAPLLVADGPPPGWHEWLLQFGSWNSADKKVFSPQAAASAKMPASAATGVETAVSPALSRTPVETTVIDVTIVVPPAVAVRTHVVEEARSKP